MAAESIDGVCTDVITRAAANGGQRLGSLAWARRGKEGLAEVLRPGRLGQQSPPGGHAGQCRSQTGRPMRVRACGRGRRWKSTRRGAHRRWQQQQQLDTARRASERRPSSSSRRGDLHALKDHAGLAHANRLLSSNSIARNSWRADGHASPPAAAQEDSSAHVRSHILIHSPPQLAATCPALPCLRWQRSTARVSQSNVDATVSRRPSLHPTTLVLAAALLPPARTPSAPYRCLAPCTASHVCGLPATATTLEPKRFAPYHARPCPSLLG